MIARCWALLPVIAAVVLLPMPLIADRYILYILNLILINCIIGLGLNILLGYAGQFAFANAALTGIGAYTVAILTYRVGVSFWIALPAAALLTAGVGLLIAIPALKISRVYLALVTLAFAQLVEWLLIHWKGVTLGADGINVPAPSLFGWRIRGDDPIYYLLLFSVGLIYLVTRRVLHSKVGRSLLAVRENEILAECNGISVPWGKAVAFGLSAFITGIGGGLFAVTMGFLSPPTFDLNMLVMQFSLVLIGGLATLPGAVIGALVITALPEVLRDAQAAQEVIYGVLLMVFVVVMPQGIAGLLHQRGFLPREVLAGGWTKFERQVRSQPAPQVPTAP